MNVATDYVARCFEQQICLRFLERLRRRKEICIATCLINDPYGVLMITARRDNPCSFIDLKFKVITYVDYKPNPKLKVKKFQVLNRKC
jgi:hypothetical protein